jgi:hypothetical protein
MKRIDDDIIRLSERGKVWLRREALKLFEKLDTFYDEVGKRHPKKVQSKSAERALQRAMEQGQLTRKSLYLETIAEVLGYSTREVELAFESGEGPGGSAGQNLLPEKSQQAAMAVIVKLRTLRIAQGVDLGVDELPKVYDAAYREFQAIRSLLENYPAAEARYSQASRASLEIGFAVLDEGLRPHLTLWRSRFMSWWDQHPAKGGSVQKRQINFPEIEELTHDLAATSRRLIQLRQKLERAVFGESACNPASSAT